MKYKCDECDNEANVFFKQTINGVTSEYHLCSECAAKHGALTENWFFPKEDFFFEGYDPIFKALFPKTLIAGQGTEKIKKCPICNSTLFDIKKKSRFGCPECYHTFINDIDLKPFIGSSGYKGKRTIKKQDEPQSELEKLKKALAEAVSREDYEKAAKLRDRIRELQ